MAGAPAGLDIVVGRQPGEFAMFGATPDARGHDRAREWLTVIERAYAEDAPFDFEGDHYRLRGVVSRPASVQRPRPLLMNAAFGLPGRDLAAQRCGALLTTFTELADHAAMDRHMAGKQAHADSHDGAVFARHRKRFAGGTGGAAAVTAPPFRDRLDWAAEPGRINDGPTARAYEATGGGSGEALAATVAASAPDLGWRQ